MFTFFASFKKDSGIKSPNKRKVGPETPGTRSRFVVPVAAGKASSTNFERPEAADFDGSGGNTERWCRMCPWCVQSKKTWNIMEPHPDTLTPWFSFSHGTPTTVGLKDDFTDGQKNAFFHVKWSPPVSHGNASSPWTEKENGWGTRAQTGGFLLPEKYAAVIGEYRWISSHFYGCKSYLKLPTRWVTIKYSEMNSSKLWSVLWQANDF